MARAFSRSLYRTVGAGLVIAAASCGVVAGLAPEATAHDSVIGAQPPVDGTVADFPEEIVLEFSGYPRDTFNMFAVTDTATGEILFDGTPTLNGRNLIITVPDGIDPGEGTYSVGFQITSSDGHATRGKTEFHVGQAAAEGASAEKAGNSEGEAEGMSPLLMGLIGLAAIAALGAVIVMVRAKAKRIEDL